MSKRIAIATLYIFDLLIILSGFLYCIYNIQTKVKFHLFGTQVPGYIFGIVSIYIGIRNFKAVQKLNRQIISNNAKFSLRNFSTVSLIKKGCSNLLNKKTIKSEGGI
ncbi:hypothetical protein ACAG39_05445 [Caldicellulosiruptoraceae bacterium PP1]